MIFTSSPGAIRAVTPNRKFKPLTIIQRKPASVINAFLFWMAAQMLDNFRVDSFGDALVGSLIYSALGMLIDSALKQLFPPK